MKWVKRILFGILITIAVVILLIYLLLWIPAVQQRIKNIALTEVMKITGNKISIGNLSLRPFNNLKLEGVYIEDLRGDTLLYADRLSAGFNLTELLNDRLLIQSVKLENFVAYVDKDSINAPFNFQFLIDAFASKDTTTKEPSKMVIEIDDVKLANGRIHYDIANSEKLPEGMFDANHIHLENVNLEVQLKSINLERLNIDLRSLAFKEKSGFELKDMKTKLTSNGHQLALNSIILKLPLSSLALKDIKLDYTGLELSEITKGASYSIILDNSVIWPSDLKVFYPPLANLTDSLLLTGAVVGKLPEINLSKFEATLGNEIKLDASAQIQDFNRWQESPVEMVIRTFNISAEGINTIENLTATKETSSGKEKGSSGLPFQLDDVSLSGEISGALPALKLRMEASSNIAKFDLNGTGGYFHSSGKVHGDVNVNVDRFKYNQYVYRNIKAHAIYKSDSVKLDLVSRDPMVPLEIKASGNLHSSKETINLSAKVQHLRLDTTNWLPSYPGADLYTHISARIKGFNPEKMEASIILDSLSFKTNKGIFKEDQVKLEYAASSQKQKHIQLISTILNANIDGNFTVNTIGESFQQTLSEYLPNLFPATKKQQLLTDNQLNFKIQIHHSDTLSKSLQLPVSIVDTAEMTGSYNSRLNNLIIHANLPIVQFGATTLNQTTFDLQTDTIAKKLNLTASTNRYDAKKDSMQVKLKINTIEKGITLAMDFFDRTSQIKLGGSLGADIHLEPIEKSTKPIIQVNLKPSTIHINERVLNLAQSHININLNTKTYSIDSFALALSETEFLKIDGSVSTSPADTLRLSIAQLQLKTLADIARLDLDIQGEAHGEIIFNQLLTTPLILTKGFSIKDIVLQGKEIGTLNLVSGWKEEIKGLLFKADLQRKGFAESTVAGRIYPSQDSLLVKADIQAIPLDWLSAFTTGTLFGLRGEIGAKIEASGKLSSPNLNGMFFMNNANIGISMLNTQYTFNDTVFIKPNSITLQDFRITDENKKIATLDGSVTYQNFKSFDPKFKLNLDNFLVLNNPSQIDSLFYGSLRINGSVDITSKDKDILVNAALTHSDNSSIMINIPESSNEAQRYSSITFINTEEDSIRKAATNPPEKTSAIALPIKLHVSLVVNSGLKLGVVINPATRDAVSVTGTGNIDFSYDLNTSAMNLLGGYTIKEGQATLSLRNITKKTFTVREGGTLAFKGDPLATAFNVTAVYSTRVDMVTLDPNFAAVMSTTKVPVNALLTASGDLNKMNLSYNVELPNQEEGVKRKVDGLMYTDDIKIKQIAYLLAFNSFYPANDDQSKNTGMNLWTSLASSSLTSQLNNLLSGVLSENWSIGTELHSNNNDLSNMEMDVNVSTRLFDDRMTLNSTMGYRNASSGGNSNNFTGDFDMQLKLTKSGEYILKVYNVTNNQYYEKAKTTQGVGVMYKKESRTFKGLFKKIKAIFK